jgi:hypothetical protein
MGTHAEIEEPLRVLINAPIVDEINGELLFHPDDVESVTLERAMNIFKKL